MTATTSTTRLLTLAGRSLMGATALASLVGATARADAYSDAVLAQNPAMYYHFQTGFGGAGTTVINSGTKGSVLDGMASAAAILGTAPGPAGTSYPGFQADNLAATFGGSNNIALSQSEVRGAINGSSAVTVEMWLNTRDTTVWQNLFSLSGNKGTALKIDLGPSGRIQVASRRSDASTYTENTIWPALTADTWFHLAIVIDYEHATLSLFKNGAIYGTSQSIAWGETDIATTLSVSATATHPTLGSTLKGSLDEVAIYSTGLTAEQINAHYQASLTASNVPEPATVSMLLGLGAIALFASRRLLSH
ncbi:PEP-CTERM putative exosortase interaction domain-containing protein [Opitutaceae bacterium TAV1]|nr:PEP-CTERM putative exosortase interaction domain-containing protein [Opitutaceae bacterium TAV1]